MRTDLSQFLASLRESGYIADADQVLLRDSEEGAVRSEGAMMREGAAKIDELREGLPLAAARAFAARPECGVALLSTAPFSLAAARAGRPLPALLDDQAQMTGRAIPCVPGFRAVRGRLARRRAILVRDRGCLCLGEDFYEAFAMAMVAEKGALAWIASSALGGGRRIGPVDAAIMRMVYVLKYGRRRAWKEA